jgi:hypothetical protein
MISGGEFLEWPVEFTEEMPSDPGYEKWLWEQALEAGPPKDDDVLWLVHRAWSIGYAEGGGGLSADEADERLAAL